MNENDARNMVIQGYRAVLHREPDPDGLSNYVNALKKGMSEERFYIILRTSEEYKHRLSDQQSTVPQNIGSHKQNVNISTYSSSPPRHTTSSMITYCMMGGNKLHEIKDYIPTVLHYVDKFVYVDSDSTDGSIEFLRELSSKNNNKVDLIIREWQDKFSYFRNFYLEHLRNQNYNGWVLTSDTDEHFPPETLSQLRNLTGGTHGAVSFRSYDIITDENNDAKIISESLSNYWKGLMFKFSPGLRYEGEPHETLVGAPLSWKRTDLIYRHTRSKLKVYYRATENFFISNSNRYSTKWGEFRMLCNKNGIAKFSQFMDKYKKGDLPGDIEDWIYNHRNDNSNEGDSEVREMAKLYYEILHPDKKR